MWVADIMSPSLSNTFQSTYSDFSMQMAAWGGLLLLRDHTPPHLYVQKRDRHPGGARNAYIFPRQAKVVPHMKALKKE
jgi:hypothetical protein